MFHGVEKNFSGKLCNLLLVVYGGLTSSNETCGTCVTVPLILPERSATMSESASNEVAVSSPGVREDIAMLSSGKSTVFSTFEGADHATKVATLNAMTNSEPISEHIGETIQLAHVIVQAVDMADDKTGEISAQPRIILIDASGKAYHAISTGLFKSLENIFGVLGKPGEWPEPLPLVIDRIKGKQGHFFTARIA